MNATKLESQLEAYVAVRSALGHRDYFLQRLLQGFVRYAARQDESPIRANVAVDWACAVSGRAGGSRLAYRLSAARGFLVFLRASYPETEVPRRGLLRKSSRRIPYILSKNEIALLLKAASTLGPPDSLRPHTYETVIGLMASTGIRVDEAIALRYDEVKLHADPPVLEIHGSKFRKSRLVPLHPTTATMLVA